MASEAPASLPVSRQGHRGLASPAQLPPARTRRAAGRHATPRPGPAARAGSRRAEHDDQGRLQQPARPQRRAGRRLALLSHPLTVICAIQAAGSFALVWSNTAFTDEADYLRIGHLLIAHWLHGTSWPAGYGDKVLSGAPAIYPPLGAVADSVGGLAGARILSLA